MKRVLIVDDAAIVRLALRYMLESNNFIVVGEADNGIYALELYKDLKPDIVTINLTMSQIDGIDTLKSIKSIDKDARIIMMSSSNNQNAKIEEALRLGAIAFLVNPFGKDRIQKGDVR